MKPFRPLIQKCLKGKIWKVRTMAARCLPVVFDPETLAQDIEGMFSSFRLDAQNELHGGLMGIKQLGQFYSYRVMKDVVFGSSL